MTQHSPPIPRLREIVRSMAGIASCTPVKEVVEIFRKEPSLPALPVADHGTFRGVISRKNLFFRHLARPFAMDLYARNPVGELMDDSPVVMAPDLDVNAALAELLVRDPALETDAFPVVAEGGCLGIVAVSDLMMRISESQTQLLHALQGLSARITEEVARASKIQQDLLPPGEFSHGGITVSAGVRTSSEIGGDFFDYFPLGEGRLGLVVADVSGHGVQCGMVTTAAKASLHTLVAQGITTPGVLLHFMNNAILATARQALLMTCLVAVIDLEREELSLANAGHNFPYLHRRGGAPEVIDAVAGYPLGFEEDCLFQELTTRFARGDALFLYSDGIVECVNREGEEFGYGRLEAFLEEQGDAPPDVLRRSLLERAARFTGEDRFDDDVTLLFVGSDGAYPR